MAAAPVRSVTGAALGAASLTLTLPGVAAGNSILLAVSYYEYDDGVDGVPSAGVSSAPANAWSLAAASPVRPVAGNDTVNALVYAAHAVAGGDTAITVAGGAGTQGYYKATAAEFSGLLAAAPDRVAGNSGTHASPTSGATEATTQADALLFAAFSAGGATAEASNLGLSTPAGWSNLARDNDAFNSMGHSADFRVVSATGAHEIAWGTISTAGQVAWGGAIAAFKAAAAAPPPPPQPPTPFRLLKAPSGRFLRAGPRFLRRPAYPALPDGSAPPPPPEPSGEVFFEGFDGNTSGQLTHVWGDTAAVSYPGDGTVLISGSASGAGVMTFPGGKDAGFGDGLFEIRARMSGGKGSGSGPALVLWPASDVWPGPEIDLGEISADGTLYFAAHWRGDDGKDYAHIRTAPGVTWAEWHTYACKLDSANRRIEFFVDGEVVGIVTEDVVPDFANGGENRAIGFMNRSAETACRCDWVRHTPLALVAAPAASTASAYVDGDYVETGYVE